MPVGPGAESVRIELYAPEANAPRWDVAVWDAAAYPLVGWNPVACDVVEATYQYGATDEAGVLSLPQAGQLDLRTRDPARRLDPSNAEGPYFGAIVPGTPVRIRSSPAAGDLPAWTGYLDDAAYDVASAAGKLRAIDGIAYLAQADVPAGTALPNTLRARVRAAIAAAGLGSVVPVEPESADPDAPADPAVAPFDGKAKTAWQVILDACQDALTYPWLDATGTLRFRSWGAFPSAPFALGCGPAGEGPWLAGLRTIEYASAADGIRNAVRAWSAVDTPTLTVSDAASVATYGQRLLAVDRVVPAFAAWSDRILADRAGAGLGVDLGEVRPYSAAELGYLLSINVDGPQVMRVRDQDHPPIIDQKVGAIGGLVRVTIAGWSFDLVAMIPRVEWVEVEPPPEPTAPPPGAYHQETRSYVASSDALVALTSGGSKYGAGAATSLPVGTWSGWTYRGLIAFPAIDWTKIRAVVSATLRLHTSDQVRVGFGSSPTIECRRITGSWSAGSSSSPSGSNAVVWPGPATTSTGAVRANVTKSENAAVGIRVDAIARAWAPTAAGGSAAAARGIALLEGSGSGADTTEFWPVEKGGANRPQLDLVLDVFD